MKFKTLLFAVAASLVALAGCQSKEDTNPSGETTFELSEDVLEFTKDAGNKTVTLTSNIAWTVKDSEKLPAWLSIDQLSGDGNATITVGVTENKGANLEHNVVFYGNKAYSATLTVKQEGPQGDAELLTVADFIQKGKEGDAKEYKLKGVVSDYSNGTSYWGIAITDATGTISAPFPANWDEWKDKIEKRGTITIKGAYSYYEQKSQDQVKNATIIDYEAAAPVEAKKGTVKEFLDAKDPSVLYELTGTAEHFNSEFCSFDLNDGTGTINVYSVTKASKDAFGSKITNGSKVTVQGYYYWYEHSTDPSKSQAEIKDGVIISVSGGEDPSEWESAATKTVAEFIAAADATTYFKLTGKISNYGASNGRFDFTDATGTIYVYEVLNKDQYTMKDGGTVTLAGKYKLYEQTPEVVSAHILSYDKSTEDPDVVLAHSLTSTIKWTLGSGAYDNTSSGTSKQSALVNGTTVDNLLKLGKSSGAGSATLTIPAGVTKIGFYSAGWQAAAITVGTKTVNVPSNAGCARNPPYTLNFTDAANYFEVDVTPGSVEVSCPTRVLLIGVNPVN